MSAPFPDGQGYMDNVWNGLSRRMREALAHARDHDGRVGALHGATRDALMTRELASLTALTDRGRALIDWARSTGRWSA